MLHPSHPAAATTALLVLVLACGRTAGNAIAPARAAAAAVPVMKQTATRSRAGQAAIISRGEAKPADRTMNTPESSASAPSISLFGPEEKELDRYSAALAATYFLRQERDKVIKDTTNLLAYMYLSLTKPDQHNRWMSSPWVSDKARRAQKNYLVQAGNIIRSNGLTTNRYNELSRILGQRKDLRDRVQHQAYLYRVNADLRGDKIHPLVDLADTTPRSDRRAKGQQVMRETRQNARSPSKKMLYAKSLREIEAMRLRQRRRLMNELGCDELPPGLCRPSMGRIAPRVRKACDRFPLVAEHIVRANGLKLEEFNRFSARSRSNVFYRWQVLRAVRTLGRRRSGD